MANYTTNVITLTQSQGAKEATINSLIDCASQALFGGRKEDSTGLSWKYYGGNLFNGGTIVAVANGTIALTGSTTNYIECTPAGVVSKNTTAFTEGSIPLYSVVTNTTTVTNYTDYRVNMRDIGAVKRTVTSTSTNLTLSSIHYGKIVLWSPAGTAAATLPANGAAAGSCIEMLILTDQDCTISAATADTLITRGDTTADSVAFTTASNKIGARVEFISNGTYWIATNKSDCTMTIGT